MCGMTLDDFKATLKEDEPADLTPPLRALWWAGRGDWDRAHHIANEIDTPSGALIHAHLHRQEGDLSNARYWYGRAGHLESTESIAAEWDTIASSLLRQDA